MSKNVNVKETTTKQKHPLMYVTRAKLVMSDKSRPKCGRRQAESALGITQQEEQANTMEHQEQGNKTDESTKTSEMQLEWGWETQASVMSGKTLWTGEELTGWENTRNSAGLRRRSAGVEQSRETERNEKKNTHCGTLIKSYQSKRKSGDIFQLQ